MSPAPYEAYVHASDSAAVEDADEDSEPSLHSAYEASDVASLLSAKMSEASRASTTPSVRAARAASQAQLRADYDVPAELAYVLVAVGITATIVREGLYIEHDELVADIDAYLHEKGRPSLRAV